MRTDEIAARFEAKRVGTGWAARCPAHDDRTASLSITEGNEGRTLLKCHAGCDFKSILVAANLKPADCFPTSLKPASGSPRRIVATYGYRNEKGELLYESVRYEPKDFRQRAPDGRGGWNWSLKGVRLVLFRLPEVLAAKERGLPVVLVEGEKDALTLAAKHFSATCNPMGAGKWKSEFSEALRGADVVIIPDNDKPGREHADAVAASLDGVASRVRIVNLPGSWNGQSVKDVSDFFAAGAEGADLISMIDSVAERRRRAGGGAGVALPVEVLPGGLDEDATEFEFANALEKLLPPIKTCVREWFACEAGTWRKLDRASLRPKAQSILPVSIRTARREATLLDHLEGRLQVRSDDFRGFHCFDDARRILINCANGIVRVSADSPPVLLPADPALLFTGAAAASFVPTATAPIFARTLAEALPDPDDRELFALCCGNFLLPDCRFEAALVAYGEAGRGKSTVAEPVASALGMDLVTRLSMSQICDPRSYHIPKLRFAAVNLGTELDVIAIDESANFKVLVSGEPVEARPIYGEPFTMQTTCKLWFLANGLPRFKNGTDAELRRTRFLRFDCPPPKKDVGLKAKLAAERDGVFNFMLAGLRRLLTVPEIPLGGAESRAVHARFKISNDPLGSFVASHCAFDPEGVVSKERLKGEFDSYCETHGLPPEFAGWLCKRLYERWPNLREVHLRRDTARVRAVAGLRLLPTGPSEEI